MVSTEANDSRLPHPVDLLDLARSGPGRKPAWTYQSTDLSLNLISLTAGQGMPNHLNVEVDVLLVGIDGTGSVVIDGRRHEVRPGHAVLIPKGSQRAVQCDSDHFAYLTCHRRRVGLMPEM